MRTLLVAATAACSHPRFAATKTIEYGLPGEGVQRVACETHNGAITIVGDPNAATIRLSAEITARAASQEANELLHELDVRQAVAEGTLTVAGQGPRTGWSKSSLFAFTLTVPPALAVELRSHNGAVRVTGTDGAIDAETHNGEIAVDAVARDVRAATHNGELRITLAGALRDVELETHNGDIVLELAGAAGAEVAVGTHNGSIHRGERVTTVQQGRSSFRGRIGDGSGKVAITTHNGDVMLR